MWWEILPSFFIVIGSLALPAVTVPTMHKLIFDHKWRRERRHWYNRMYIRRDLRLTGNYYQLEGLDALPDEPAPAAPSKEHSMFRKKNPGPLYWMT